MKIIGEEIFFSYLVTSILKELFEVKNDINVYFRTSLWYLKQFFYLSEAQKGSVKIKKNKSFFYLILDWDNKFLSNETCIFKELLPNTTYCYHRNCIFFFLS